MYKLTNHVMAVTCPTVTVSQVSALKRCQQTLLLSHLSLPHLAACGDLL